MRRALGTLSTVVVALLAGHALAHAHLASSQPAAGATVASAGAVVLRFTEPVEASFSMFKVLRLDEALAAVDMPAQDVDASHDRGDADDHEHGDAQEGASHDHADAEDHEHDPTALDAAVEAQARAVAAAVLADPGFSAGALPLVGDPVGDPNVYVTLVFTRPLEPGTYVVVWRALSVDTHASDGWFVFEVSD